MTVNGDPRNAARRRLSARSTLFCRLVLPAAWILGFGAAALAPWVLALVPGSGHEVHRAFSGLFVALWATGAGFLVWFARPLRDVWIDGDQLRVVNFRKTLHVPLEALERVEDSHHLRPKLIHVYPERRPGLPECVTFIPALRRVFPLGPHPVIRELHEAIDALRDGASARS